MAAIIDWALVRSLPVFSGMDDAAFEQLMGLAMQRAVPKGSAFSNRAKRPGFSIFWCRGG